MKLLKHALVLACCICLSSCNEEQKVRAKITERKHLPGNQLQVKYTFLHGDKRVSDSLVILNQVLEGDSITLRWNPNQQDKSTIIFNKE